jgi:hypothetical protein
VPLRCLSVAVILKNELLGGRHCLFLHESQNWMCFNPAR